MGEPRPASPIPFPPLLGNFLLEKGAQFSALGRALRLGEKHYLQLMYTNHHGLFLRRSHGFIMAPWRVKFKVPNLECWDGNGRYKSGSMELTGASICHMAMDRTEEPTSASADSLLKARISESKHICLVSNTGTGLDLIR